MAPEQLRLVDGTIVRKCPTEKPLYCSKAGKFYSVHGMQITDEGCIMREIKPNLAQVGSRRCTHTNGYGTHYPFLRQFGAKHCHYLVAVAWYGPRPEGMVIDHLNGNILDWSADNLEFVTPAENNKRAKLLRVLRKALGAALTGFTYADYHAWFALPDAEFEERIKMPPRQDPNALAEREVTKYCDE